MLNQPFKIKINKTIYRGNQVCLLSSPSVETLDVSYGSGSEAVSSQYLMPTTFLSNVISLPRKVDELTVILNNNKTDICLITESWMTEEIPVEIMNIDKCTCHLRNRNDERRGGGVFFGM